MTNPLVSVVIPAFNAQSTLRDALDSVQRQNFFDYECLIVDDGSTDDTLAIAQCFAENDARFEVYSIPHAGIVVALNHAIEHARGRYVARFDADDVMVEQRLQRQFELLERESALVGVGCHVKLFPEERLTAGRSAYEAWLNSLTSPGALYRDRFVECPLAHPTFFFRREVLARFPYRDVSWPEDYDLLLRLFAAGCSLGTVPLPLLRWRDGGDRLSRTSERYSMAQFVACKAHFLAEDWLGQRSRYLLWGYGDTGRNLARALSSRGKLPKYIVERHPRRLGQCIMGARVIAPEQIAEFASEDSKIIVSVAGDGPRSDVRRTATSLGLVEGRHFVCAA